MAIEFCWPQRDVGLGTAYERLAIYRRIFKWYEQCRPATAVEGPVDGVAGLPGLHLLPVAQLGVHVTVVLPSADALEAVKVVYSRMGLSRRLETVEAAELPRHRSFDWAVSFNALPLASDWRGLLRALSARAKWLALFISHPWSYGTWLVRAGRIGFGARTQRVFDHESTRARRLEREIREIGQIEDVAWVDCPWWPDLFVEAGETLAGKLRIPRRARPHPRFVYDAATFPYGTGAPAELTSRLARHPEFESSRLAPIFAHHRAYLIATQPHAG